MKNGIFIISAPRFCDTCNSVLRDVTIDANLYISYKVVYLLVNDRPISEMEVKYMSKVLTDDLPGIVRTSRISFMYCIRKVSCKFSVQALLVCNGDEYIPVSMSPSIAAV